MGAVSISRMGGPPPFIALAKTLATIKHTMDKHTYICTHTHVCTVLSRCIGYYIHVCLSF